MQTLNRLDRPASLLDWQETGSRRYIGGDYEIAFVEAYRWELRYRGEHLEFDDSRENTFRVAENHHRERLRVRDLMWFGAIVVASTIAFFVMLALPRDNGLWVLVLGAVWVAFVSAGMRFVLTLVRIGRLRGGATYATSWSRPGPRSSPVF